LSWAPDAAHLRRTDDEEHTVPDGPTTPSGGNELTPDELEQRQRADGTFDDDPVLEDLPDRPLTPDEIEQRQVVEGDDEDEPRE
jgi:hypothetical protein